MKHAEIKVALDGKGTYRIEGSPFALIPICQEFINKHPDLAEHIVTRAGLKYVSQKDDTFYFSLSRGPFKPVWAVKRFFAWLRSRRSKPE